MKFIDYGTNSFMLYVQALIYISVEKERVLKHFEDEAWRINVSKSNIVTTTGNVHSVVLFMGTIHGHGPRNFKSKKNHGARASPQPWWRPLWPGGRSLKHGQDNKEHAYGFEPLVFFDVCPDNFKDANQHGLNTPMVELVVRPDFEAIKSGKDLEYEEFLGLSGLTF